MDRSATNSATAPVLRSAHAPRKSYDARILFVSALIAVAAVVAIYAATQSGPIDPTTFGTMVAFP